jgi:hypothetical protein
MKVPAHLYVVPCLDLKEGEPIESVDTDHWDTKWGDPDRTPRVGDPVIVIPQDFEAKEIRIGHIHQVIDVYESDTPGYVWALDLKAIPCSKPKTWYEIWDSVDRNGLVHLGGFDTENMHIVHARTIEHVFDFLGLHEWASS